VNEWVWSIGGMVLTGENRSNGRETLYRVGGRWMNGYGALVEWYWQGETEVLGEKPVTVPLCPPPNSHVLNWDQDRVSALKGRRQSAWPLSKTNSFNLTWIIYNIEFVPRSKRAAHLLQKPIDQWCAAKHSNWFVLIQRSTWNMKSVGRD